MSDLKQAFVISLNKENKDFVGNPYRPISIYNSGSGSIPISPISMTQARCFDIKYGSQNYFSPK